jgi:hypothetical protein
MSLDVYLRRDAPCVVYDDNITHNLAPMAREAGIYEHLWRPDELGINTAIQLIEPLEQGLELLRSDPARFKKLDALNRWGVYENLVTFVERYIAACKEHPDASVEVSR